MTSCGRHNSARSPPGPQTSEGRFRHSNRHQENYRDPSPKQGEECSVAIRRCGTCNLRRCRKQSELSRILASRFMPITKPTALLTLLHIEPGCRGATTAKGVCYVHWGPRILNPIQMHYSPRRVCGMPVLASAVRQLLESLQGSLPQGQRFEARLQAIPPRRLASS